MSNLHNSADFVDPQSLNFVTYNAGKIENQQLKTILLVSRVQTAHYIAQCIILRECLRFQLDKCWKVVDFCLT